MSYASISQNDDDDSLETASLIGPASPKRPVIDLSSLDHGLKRWLAFISDKTRARTSSKPPMVTISHGNSTIRYAAAKIKLELDEDALTPIHTSVFTPTLSLPSTLQRTLSHTPSHTHAHLQEALHLINLAISQSLHPKLNKLGSSGSYFCKTPDNETIAIFKPKDEEPYGALNPKWTKWLHRNLLPFSFGRACLIPNLSYLSESAASVLDDRLALGIVPKTEVVDLSSTAFYYDWIDRRGERKGKRLPDKEGSLQLFAKGFVDASLWLDQHPWPASDGIEAPQGRRRGFSWSVKRFLPQCCIVLMLEQLSGYEKAMRD